VKEEFSDIKVTRRSRSTRPRWEPEIETFSEEDVKGEKYSDNDHDAQTPVKIETPSTNKRSATTKGKTLKVCLYHKNLEEILLGSPTSID
jgi:hypothetical protein